MHSRPLTSVARSLLVAALGVAPAAASAQALDLIGTWYVLVHYQDSATANPEAWRWDDRVWVFEREGSRVRWTEYTIVVFDDDDGRWEGRHRVLAAWEPSESQMAEVRRGLQVNSRGSKSKTLRPTRDGSVWETPGRASVASALVVSYTEDWNVEDPTGMPVFTRDDALGSGSMEEVAGRTRYSTTEVLAGGNELRGTFVRDGTREGRFRMVRAGAQRGLEKAAKTAEERFQKEVDAVRERILASPEGQAMVADTLGEELRAAGVQLPDDELAGLAREGARMLGEGVSEATVAARLAESASDRYFAFAEKGASHDPNARYGLPFDPSVPRKLTQGVNGDFSHKGRHGYAFDFDMPEGTEIVAAREGTVVRVVDGFTKGGRAKGLMGKANTVTVLHPDGTFAQYVHLRKGIPVEEGTAVERGRLLGYSGNTGYTTHPHLHFAVWALDDTGEARTVSIRFADGSSEGYVPAEGLYYGGDTRADAD